MNRFQMCAFNCNLHPYTKVKIAERDAYLMRHFAAEDGAAAAAAVAAVAAAASARGDVSRVVEVSVEGSRAVARSG